MTSRKMSLKGKGKIICLTDGTSAYSVNIRTPPEGFLEKFIQLIETKSVYQNKNPATEYED